MVGIVVRLGNHGKKEYAASMVGNHPMDALWTDDLLQAFRFNINAWYDDITQFCLSMTEVDLDSYIYYIDYLVIED